ncbi:MAG: hypothetical protein M3063_10845 [Actinomycetota bacterium]|nr:hypothetical protein [Actinomycetota bacterium]
MGEAEPHVACPVCREASRRVFHALRVARTPAGVAGAHDRADASASEPSVVTR